ncbi:hypothetical protein [Phyllobacterium phragmitis]|uniref:hypothetical protein n=1 Tax=Phyllobacterium phragmitis TaxID=2670329 RepID=UPI001304851B|nr:hypothetical protein [Phyllobacterium phragmitis]
MPSTAWAMIPDGKGFINRDALLLVYELRYDKGVSDGLAAEQKGYAGIIRDVGENEDF